MMRYLSVDKTELYGALLGCPENGVKPDDIEAVMVEIRGTVAGPSWHWIAKLKEQIVNEDGTTSTLLLEQPFCYIVGNVMYEAWDVKSKLTIQYASNIDLAISLMESGSQEQRFCRDLYNGSATSIAQLLTSAGIEVESSLLVVEQRTQKGVVHRSAAPFDSDLANELWPKTYFGEIGRLSVPNFIAHDRMFLYVLDRGEYPTGEALRVKRYYRSVNNYVPGQYAVPVIDIVIDTRGKDFQVKEALDQLPLYTQS